MSSKIQCHKCHSQIGEIKSKKEIYFHKDQEGHRTCFYCDNKENDRTAEISFFIIFGIALTLVILFLY